MGKRHRVVVALLGTALVAGILATTTSAGAAGKSKVKNIKIIGLFETKGESVSAIPNFADGAALAVEDLKKKGVTVDYERIAAPLPASQAQAALLQAYDKNPNAILGLPASSQVVPLGPTIVQKGIPFIAMSTTDTAVNGAPSGGPNLFLIRPLNVAIADVDLDYAVKDLKAKRIFLFCVQNIFGTQGCDRVKSQVAAKYPNVKIVGEASGSTTATDLTNAVLEAKNADPDVIIEFNFPNPTGVFSKQLIDNGVDVPVVDGASSGLAVASGALSGKALENLVGVDDCNPTADKRPSVKKWVKAYKAKYGYDPNYASAQAYDAVNLFVTAAQQAGSTDPAKMVEALSKLTYEGICNPKYNADKRNVLSFSANLVKWNPDLSPKVIKRVALPFVAPVATTTTTAATTQ